MLHIQKRFLIFISLTFIALFSFFSSNFADITDKTHPLVLVSVSPHKFFLKKIAGDTIDIMAVVPAGSSAHTYEPSSREMLKASKADIWFYIGESFEKKALQALQSHHPELIAIDLREGLNLIEGNCRGECMGYHAHHTNEKNSNAHQHAGLDLHIWLSARMAKQQAKTMANALLSRYPQHTQFYQENLNKFLKELDDLDNEIQNIMKSATQNHILVAHPAYGYFCRDYNLVQIPIEVEGKDPTSKQMTHLLQQAKDLNLKTIFVQKEYPNKGAKLVASALNGKLVTLEPYSEDYFNAMINIANGFAKENP